MSARMAMEGTDVEIAHHVMGDDVVLRIVKGTYEVLRCSSRRSAERTVQGIFAHPVSARFCGMGTTKLQLTFLAANKSPSDICFAASSAAGAQVRERTATASSLPMGASLHPSADQRASCIRLRLLRLVNSSRG
jgi:hypothetical protein